MGSTSPDWQAYCGALFESPHVLIAVLDRELRFERVNRAYAEATGRPPEVFPGQRHFDLYPNAENEEIFRRVLETGESFTVREKPFAHPDLPGTPLTFWDWSLVPVRGQDGRVDYLVLQLLDVTDKVTARRLAAEHEVLLRELHHRVKNNLQIIGALLRDTKRRHPDIAAALDPTLGHISTIARIHDLVAGDSDLGSIDLGTYALSIAQSLEALHARPEIRIEVEGACPVPLDLASPLGMILHELVCNALEHAFPHGGAGRIEVIVRCDDSTCELEVCDDGVGLPEDRTTSDGSSGLDLVHGLTRQISGRFEAYAITPRGTCCHLRVPLPRRRP